MSDERPYLTSVTPAEPAPADWDAYIRQHPRGHILQLSAWGTLKAAYGWQVARTAIFEGGRIVGGAQLLFRRLPLRLGTLAYLPYGGCVDDEALYPALWQAVRHTAQRRGAAFLKWEPGLSLDGPGPEPALWGFRPSPQTIQPPRTVILDISGDEDAILARMNQGTRRKIRQSLKNDVRYFEATAADVERFTRIMQITGERNDFGVHEPDYYAMQYGLFVPQDAALILAEHEGEVLSGVFVFTTGATAQYISGASSNQKRNLMASYGVQWQAIRWAKARGCRYYDMWGIPDEDEATLEAQFQERNDGLWGVYGFKRGWGGQVVRSAGTWDLVYNPLIYAAYRAALRWREATPT